MMIRADAPQWTSRKHVGEPPRPEGWDEHLELEQTDAWRVFFATPTCKIRKEIEQGAVAIATSRARGARFRATMLGRMMLFTPEQISREAWHTHNIRRKQAVFSVM
jgi:hypothetical protein